MIQPRDIAIKLLSATALPDDRIFTDLSVPRYTKVDYYRMACHAIFSCRRCGTCCTTGSPIRLRSEDVEMIARHQRIPLTKAIKKYAVPDPDRPGVLDFKHDRPCKFYDPTIKGCKIYEARPWSCRIFPFLGIYGSEDKVKVHESCPGSVEAMNSLMAALDEVRSKTGLSVPSDPEAVKRAKEWLRSFLNRL